MSAQSTKWVRTGFSLIEILLAVAAGSLIVGGLSAVFAMNAESSAKQEAMLEAEEQGARAMTVMLRAVRSAEAITVPASGTSSVSLTLDMPDAQLDPTIFSAATGTLRVAEGASPAVALTNSRVSVSRIVFTNLSAPTTSGTTRIEFDLAYVNPSGKQAYTYRKTFTGSATLR